MVARAASQQAAEAVAAVRTWPNLAEAPRPGRPSPQARAVWNRASILNEYQDYRRDNYRYDFVVKKLAPFHDAYVELSNRMKSYRNQAYFNLGRKAAERGDEIAAFDWFPHGVLTEAPSRAAAVAPAATPGVASISAASACASSGPASMP